MNIADPKIESYAAQNSSKETSVFKALVKATHKKTKWPQMQVGHLEGQFLKLMVKAAQAKRVLEIGTFTGYSALALAEGLPENGKVITLDIDPINTQIALEHWKQHPAGRKIKLILGPALDSLRNLKGPFDAVFIDADKTNYLNYWNAVLPKVRRGCIVLVDNVLWSGEVLKPRDQNSRSLAKFNRTIKSDPRVDCAMLTIRDGITLAVKK